MNGYALEQDDENVSKNLMASGHVGGTSSGILEGMSGESFFHAGSEVGYEVVDVLKQKTVELATGTRQAF